MTLTIAHKYRTTLQACLESTLIYTPNQLIPLIDYTCLENHATPLDIQTLSNKAFTHKVAAVCVYPEHLAFIPPSLPLIRATVINFPGGNDAIELVLHAIEQISSTGMAHEIDYVFPYQAYLNGDENFALSHCHQAYKACKQRGLLFKVIIETGAHPSMQSIYDLCKRIIDSGCDFLKTSTGKISQGASIEAAFAILLAIQESGADCGIKLSGGIKSVEQAIEYVKLAQIMLNTPPNATWLRLGASSLLDACLFNSRP
jgi:deoxyribose-phosphate aldolase